MKKKLVTTRKIGLSQKDEVFLWEEEKQRSKVAICHLTNCLKRSLVCRSRNQEGAIACRPEAESATAPRGFGKEMLMQAIAHIRQAIQIVEGRLIYLDCKDKLVPYYESNGFKLLQKQNDLNQMYFVV